MIKVAREIEILVNQTVAVIINSIALFNPAIRGQALIFTAEISIKIKITGHTLKRALAINAGIKSVHCNALLPASTAVVNVGSERKIFIRRSVAIIVNAIALFSARRHEIKAVAPLVIIAADPLAELANADISAARFRLGWRRTIATFVGYAIAIVVRAVANFNRNQPALAASVLHAFVSRTVAVIIHVIANFS
jgi:hypothetical protein